MKEGWSYQRLGEVCDLYQPKTIPAKLFDENGRHLVYGSNGIIGRYNAYNHKEPEVIIACRGTCGMVNMTQPYSWINGNAMVIHPKSGVISKDFLKYCLCRIDMSDVITGTSIPQITRQSLSPVIIGIPSHSVQEHIVTELNLIQGILAKQNALLQELQRLSLSIFHDMFGSPLENKSGCKQDVLKNYASFKNGLNYEKTDKGIRRKILGVSDFQDRVSVDSSVLPYIHLTKEVEENYYLKDNDIVFVRSNGSKSLVGRSMRVKTNGEKVLFSGFCIRCRIESDSIHPVYLSAFVRNPQVKDLLTRSGRGCNIQNLNQTVLGDLVIPIPPIEKQIEFASLMGMIENQRSLIIKSTIESQTLFDYTMDKYFG